MDTVREFRWALEDPTLKFPAAGFLAEYEGRKEKGGLGFRPGPEGCLLWHVHRDDDCDWPTLIERVTAQARKGKYARAIVSSDLPLPQNLFEALEEAGFTGAPLSRAVIPDVPKELHPYLDWSGRLTQVALGKGSDAINAQLYAHVAKQIPLDRVFSEPEINQLLGQLSLTGDHTSLRRELVDRGYLARTRDCRKYWKSPALDQSPG